MTTTVSQQDDTLVLRSPTPDDAKAVAGLVRDSGVLDCNSDYAYLLLCDHFRETCLIAMRGEELAGFVLGYCPPQRPSSLFVWQVAVADTARRQGLAGRMLDELFRRQVPSGCRFLEATVTPSNQASRALFQSFAGRHAAPCSVSAGFAAGMFSDAEAHEPEELFRIGPMAASPDVGSQCESHPGD